MTKLRKTLMTTALTTALACGIASHAVAGAIFTIAPSALPAGTFEPFPGLAPFSADLIIGASSELASFTGGGIGVGTTTGNGWLNFSTYKLGAAFISPLASGLLINYGLYATFTLVGTHTAGPGGGTPGTVYTLSTADFKVWADPNLNTGFTSATAGGATGTAATASSGTGDDILLALGSLLAPGTGTVGVSALGGAFANTINNFDICTGAGTAKRGGNAVAGVGCLFGTGAAFFAGPVPFYNLAFSEFNNTSTGITVAPNGSIAINDASGAITFGTRIPEPGSLALMGIALAGLGFASRRGKKKLT